MRILSGILSCVGRIYIYRKLPKNAEGGRQGAKAHDVAAAAAPVIDFGIGCSRFDEDKVGGG